MRENSSQQQRPELTAIWRPGAPAPPRNESADPEMMRISSLHVLAAAILLCAVAYFPILGWEPPIPEVEGPVQSFFFEPAETSPQLVYGLVALLLFRRRQRILAALATPAASPTALPVLALGLLLYLWAAYTASTDLMILSLIPFALGVALALGGSPLLSAILRPTLLLFFAVPLPAVVANQVVYPLQIGTADLSTWMLSTLDIPVVQRADLLFSRDRVFQVIESCSGLRSMETLVMAGVVYAELLDRQRLHAALLLVAAPLVAFVLNGARVVSIVLTAGDQARQDHTFQGLVTILCGVLVIHAFDRLLARWLPRWASPPPGWDTDGPRADAVRGPRAATPAAVAVVLGAAALLATSRAWLTPWEPPVTQMRWGVPLPQRWGEFESRQLTVDRDFLGRIGFSRRLTRAYESGDGRIEVLLGYDDLLNGHRNAISPKLALPGAGWEVETRDRISLDGFPPTVTRVVARSGSRQMLSLSWYEGARGIWTETARALVALDRSPARRPEGITAVRVSTLVTEAPTGRSEAEERLLRFAEELRPLVVEAAERIATDAAAADGQAALDPPSL